MSNLITDDLKAIMIQNGQETADGRERDRMPVVKLFVANATWILTELDPSYPDTAFGLCDLGLGYPELGYVSVNELEELKVKTPYGELTVERDEYFDPQDPLSVYTEAARLAGQITEDHNYLKRAAVNCLYRLQKKKNPKPD